MTTTLLFLISLQVVLFHIDEYYFHRKRTLCRKEVVSMFIDGALYLPPLVIACFAPFNDFWSWVFIVFSVLSCLSITKNEWFYNYDLNRPERIVHSFLYILHPILLYGFYYSWQQNYFAHNLNFWIIQIVYVGFGVRTLAHQLIYWNYLRTDCV
ncbi:MAG: hypothetical protein KDD40_11200 [Bdellovibrionales bacterium]|nr:hypothetical protein [Bdellovibrionales bacterium]